MITVDRIKIILSTALLQMETINMVDDGIIYKEDRIQVRLGAAAPVITLLLACLGLSVLVLFKRPQDVVPRDPRSIGGMALLLQCNPDLSHDFRSDFQHLRYQLQHERFLTLLPSNSDFKFAIVREAMNPGFRPTESSIQNGDMPTWWQPVTFSIWYRLLAAFLPLALIGVLEGVQQVSDHSNGVATAFSTDAAHYAITILPAIVMFSIGVLYRAINFNTNLLAPYYALSKGSTSDRSLFSNDLGRLPLMQLLSALRQRHLAAASTTLAVAIGPWLIVIVSFLYSISEQDTAFRITQNPAPKLALQVLLGTMALCVVLSWLFMRKDALLPHNPCSIAGIAALLAGSELWKARHEERREPQIPSGAEWMCTEDLQKHGIWKDNVFGLGWWPNGRYGIDSGGRIDGG